MLKEAIDTYLSVRRASGFKLHDDECSLNSFARFATARGEMRIPVKLDTESASNWTVIPV